VRVHDDNRVTTLDLRNESATRPYSVQHQHILCDLARARAATIALLADRVGMELRATRAALRDLQAQNVIRRSSRGWVITELGRQQIAARAVLNRDVAAPMGDDLQGTLAAMGDDLQGTLAASASSVFAAANQLTHTQGKLARVFASSLDLGRIAQSVMTPLLSSELSAAFSTVHLAGRVVVPPMVDLTAAIGQLSGVAALVNSQQIARMVSPVIPTTSAMSAFTVAVAGLPSPTLNRLSVALPPFGYPDGIVRALAVPAPPLFSTQRLLASIVGRMATVLPNFMALTKWRDLFENGRIEAAFTAIGLPPSLSMEMQLIQSVIHWYEAGAAPEQIRAAVMAHYDANGCADLAALVDRLCASPDMAGRAPTLEHAFLDHQEGRDAGTIFILIPMVEGILRPAIRQMTTPTTKLSHNKMPGLLLSSPLAHTAGRIGGAILRAVTTYLEDRFFKDFHPGDLLEDQVRHPYLHGIILTGTRMESLACFLLLDAIVDLLDLCRESGIMV